jgi:hypothetical protein
MDVGKSFAFVFEDQRWATKILIGAAILLAGVLFSWLLLVPLIAALALLAGYGAEIARRVIRGDTTQLLPEWNDWQALLADGLKVMVIVLVYAVPMILLSTCLGIPIGILSDQGQTANAVSSLFGVALGLLNFLLGIALSMLVPAAIGFYVDRGDLGAAFRFGEVFAFVRDHLVTYLVTFLMTWVASIVGQAGSIVCGIGWFATIPYSAMVTGHLYGQAFAVARGQAAAPVADSA